LIVKRWETFKSEKGVESTAMDDLLKMIGLKKVKDFAFTTFESFYNLNKMSDEFKKKNPMTLNFCFLGNAVNQAGSIRKDGPWPAVNKGPTRL